MRQESVRVIEGVMGTSLELVCNPFRKFNYFVYIKPLSYYFVPFGPVISDG